MPLVLKIQNNWVPEYKGSRAIFEDNMYQTLPNTTNTNATTRTHPGVNLREQQFYRWNNYYVDRHEEEKSTRSFVQPCINAIVYLFLFIFSICVLVVSHRDAVLTACGNGLWILVLIRLVFGFLMIATTFVGMLIGLAMPESVRMSIIPALVFCRAVAYATMAILEIYYSHQALTTTACNNAMSSCNTLNSPLLAIIAIIYATFDGIWLLISICICCPLVLYSTV